MNPPHKSSSPCFRRTAPAGTASCARSPETDPVSGPFELACCRSHPRPGTAPALQAVHNKKTVLPRTRQARYNFHGC